MNCVKNANLLRHLYIDSIANGSLIPDVMSEGTPFGESLGIQQSHFWGICRTSLICNTYPLSCHCGWCLFAIIFGNPSQVCSIDTASHYTGSIRCISPRIMSRLFSILIPCVAPTTSWISLTKSNHSRKEVCHHMR